MTRLGFFVACASLIACDPSSEAESPESSSTGAETGSDPTTGSDPSPTGSPSDPPSTSGDEDTSTGAAGSEESSGGDEPVEPPGPSNFEERCSAPGVVLCEGFDEAATVDPWLQPAGDGVMRAVLDAELAASGGSSLRFEIPGLTAANSSGAYDIVLPTEFGANSTFYVQYRQRFSPEMLEVDFSGGGWKQSIFANQAASCAAIEITTVNVYRRNFPTLYDQCGEGFDVELPGGDFLLQWSEDWPETPHPNAWVECHYQNQAPPPDGGCFMYRADDWMTFSYEVHVGDWGQPNGSVKAWAGYDGEPLQQIVDLDPWTAYPNGDGTSSSDSYNRVILLPYNTGKDSSHDHPTAWTWYDELIVSTEPIAPPL